MPFHPRSQLDRYLGWHLARAPEQHALQSLHDPEHRRLIYRIANRNRVKVMDGAVAQTAIALLTRQDNP